MKKRSKSLNKNLSKFVQYSVFDNIEKPLTVLCV